MRGSLLFARDFANIAEIFEAIMVSHGVNPYVEPSFKPDPFEGMFLSAGDWSLRYHAGGTQVSFCLDFEPGQKSETSIEVYLYYEFEDDAEGWYLAPDLPNLEQFFSDPIIHDLAQTFKQIQSEEGKETILAYDAYVAWGAMVTCFRKIREQG